MDGLTEEIDELKKIVRELMNNSGVNTKLESHRRLNSYPSKGSSHKM